MSVEMPQKVRERVAEIRLQGGDLALRLAALLKERDSASDYEQEVLDRKILVLGKIPGALWVGLAVALLVLGLSSTYFLQAPRAQPRAPAEPAH